MVAKNFNTILTDLKGKPIPLTPEGKENLTLGEVACTGLTASFPDDKISAKDKLIQYNLAVKLAAGGEQDVNSEEIELIKKLVDKAYGPLIYGQVDTLLKI